MLGVATLIVVNSVMSGFSTKLKERLHGLLSDVILESHSYDGFSDPYGKMARIRSHPELAGKVEAMSPTLEIFAMIQFRFRGEMITRPVRLIGVDPEGRTEIGGFAEYLLNPENRRKPSFELPPAARQRYEENQRAAERFTLSLPPEPLKPGEKPPPELPPSEPFVPKGIIVGNAIASFRDKAAPADAKAKDIYILQPGDTVTITTVSATIPTSQGAKLLPVTSSFAVCDYFKSEMSEYDSNYVFVPLDYLQRLRTMEDRVTGIQIRLKDYRDAGQVTEALAGLFPESAGLHVSTWKDKQGPLLAAIEIERGLLNILLFLIIAVAGFGILAIFSMIVTEKTRDIGILKALGASNGGVMNIFLGYGLLLGLVGAGLGSGLGLTLTVYINEIEKLMADQAGREIFDKTVYYFNEIPTDIQFWNVFLVNVGAVAIAVLFSVLPALRAALLHPVRALRYE
jgi:lipoprotein-releasing system permease protein